MLCCSQVRREYEALRKSRLDEFMGGFNIISLKLKEMYQVQAFVQKVPRMIVPEGPCSGAESARQA